MSEHAQLDSRFECTGLIDLYEVTKTGKLLARGPGLIDDVSASGARIQTDGSIPVGTELVVKSRTAEVRAVVCDATEDELTFSVGVRFTSGFKASGGAKPLPVPPRPAPAQTPVATATTTTPAETKAGDNKPRTKKKNTFQELMRLIGSARQHIQWLSVPPDAQEEPSEAAEATPSPLPPLQPEALDLVPAPAILVDTTGRIQYSNEEFRSGFLQWVPGSDLSACVVHADVARIGETMVSATAAPAQTVEICLSMLMRDGTVQPMRSLWKYSASRDLICISFAASKATAKPPSEDIAHEHRASNPDRRGAEDVMSHHRSFVAAAGNARASMHFGRVV